jgi:Cu-Zn family superoxide dismutase
MAMRNWTAGLLFVLAAAIPAHAQKKAHAELINSKGQPVGTATLKQTKAGVNISLSLEGLPPGTHGFHIHAVGKCDAPDFKTAGPHFNPAGKKHGARNPEGAHNGDLGNIAANAKGIVKTTKLAKDVTLGPGANSLFQPDGTSLVIHADSDDEMTDPSGNSGPRIACGVIEK